MKILNITAQKPNSTGSGIYLTELIKAFDKLNCQQVLIAGINKSDTVSLPCEVEFCPVTYNSSDLPFPILGMSDEMPYESTRYCEMTIDMMRRFRTAFVEAVTNVLKHFKPDIILCHHLYLLTSIIREEFPLYKIAGICHGTDIRQIKKQSLNNENIIKNIRNLDIIFALHQEQKSEIALLYGVDVSKIYVIGSGYNNNIFRKDNSIEKDMCTSIIYAGKISEKKGVISLIKALNSFDFAHDKLKLKIAGGKGSNNEYEHIVSLIKKCPYPVEFLGKLSQKQLSEQFNKSDIFILPSFYEGLPLVIIEALACGLKVIATDIKGVRNWLDENIPNNGINYIELPRLRNTDEPYDEDLPMFEMRIGNALKKSIDDTNNVDVDLSNLSWNGLSEKILNIIKNSI